MHIKGNGNPKRKMIRTENYSSRNGNKPGDIVPTP